jgi:cytochrome c biogenesis protein CcdA
MNGLLTLAFTAGLLAPANPCGFALLPAYLGHTATEQADQPVSRRLARALGIGAALGIGFAATLSAAGLAISAGAHPILTAAPWLGFSVGVVLVVLGIVALTGRGPALRLRLPLPAIRAPRSSTGVVRWALFGVGYGIASLACTFAVLFAVIAQAQATTGVAGQTVVFAAYAAGSLALLLPLAAVAALAGAAAARFTRTLSHWQPLITAGLLIVTGAYVAAYWWPAVTHAAPTGHGLRSLDRWSAGFADWLQQHDALMAGLAGAIALTVAATRLFAHARAARRRVPAAALDEDWSPPADGPPPTPRPEHRGAASRQ